MTATDPLASLWLRSLSRSDLLAVLEIEQASFTTPWRQSTFASLLERHDTDLVAAVGEDGRLAGYAVSWTILDQAELGNVAVAPDARGRGAGRMLVEAVLQRARRRGARECYLEVRESNRVAQRLYLTLGFQVVGRRRRYYASPPEDALVMKADL
jgi:ribosomal-protein-alanine N-acetyltransferase